MQWFFFHSIVEAIWFFLRVTVPITRSLQFIDCRRIKSLFNNVSLFHDYYGRLVCLISIISTNFFISQWAYQILRLTSIFENKDDHFVSLQTKEANSLTLPCRLWLLFLSAWKQLHIYVWEHQFLNSLIK
jgi:hypothetical protein